jgi:hypothetical protein
MYEYVQYEIGYYWKKGEIFPFLVVEMSPFLKAFYYSGQYYTGAKNIDPTFIVGILILVRGRSYCLNI